MGFLWKRTVTVKVVEAFGVLMILAVGLLFFVETKLNDIGNDKDRLDQIRTMTADAKLLQLSVANVWQFFTDASLTRDRKVVDEEAQPNYAQALAALQHLLETEKTLNTGALADGVGLESRIRQMYQTGDRMFYAYSRNWDDGNRVMEEYDRICDTVIKGIDEKVKVLDTTYSELSDDITGALHRLFVTMLVVVSLIVVIGAFSAFVLAREITRPLHLMLDSIKRLARGDLTHRVEFKDSGDLGELVTSINTLTDNLRGIVEEVDAGAANISHGSREIAHGVDDLSQRTEGQASSLEQTASSMEQMTSAVRQSADNAQQMNQMVKVALKEAEEGGNIVNNTVTAMTEIDASSTRIADIIGVIDEIAFQTNLLALNAAVEAARAGEQGKGFAVVAAEVRNLAQRSATAAKEIKGLIEDSVGKVKMGKHLVDQSGEILHKIIANVSKVAGNASEVSSASQEQSAGIEQINKAVMQMDEMTQQNAALVEEASAATRAMEEQAHKLVERISYFKLNRGGGIADGRGGAARTGTRQGTPRVRTVPAVAG